MSPTMCDVLVGIFTALNATDFVTTWIALRNGARERNPLVARWPVVTGIAKVVLTAAIVVEHRTFYGSVALPVALALVVAATFWVVATNVRVILSLRRGAE